MVNKLDVADTRTISLISSLPTSPTTSLTMVYLTAAQTIGSVTIPAYTIGILFCTSADGFFIGANIGSASDNGLYYARRLNSVWDYAKRIDT